MQVENISWEVGKRNRLESSGMSFKVNTKSKPKTNREEEKKSTKTQSRMTGTGDPMLQEHRVTTR